MNDPSRDWYAVRDAARRRAGHWAFHRARYAHRLELFRVVGDDQVPVWPARYHPVWTLVITGPTIRTWGFIDRIKGCFVEWTRYTRGERC